MLGALADVVRSPQRLQVAVVEALSLLFWVGQVKARARTDVVDVPAVTTIGAPARAISELRLKMLAELFDRAADQIGSRLRFVGTTA